ncbi:MAG TPA: hypothetical protein VF070_05205 [Streptosporangiaceae bacterium]
MATLRPTASFSTAAHEGLTLRADTPALALTCTLRMTAGLVPAGTPS